MPAGPLIGIDIGSQQIKIAELRPGKNGLSVTGLAIGLTPFGIIQNNIVTDPQAMGQAIKQLMRESGISVKKAVGCISGQNAVVIRIIEVPRMTDSELKETMKWEVERHVPFAPSETVLDYQPLQQRTPEAQAAPNMEVLLAVAQQDAVNNYVDTLFAAGLDPVAIDIEPLAIARAVLDVAEGQPVARPQLLPGQEFDGPLPETVAVVNVGAANTDIGIYQGDQLTFPRSLPLAGDSLTRAIAEMLQYTLDQAERVKRDYAVIQLDRMAVYTGTHWDGEGDGPQFTEEADFNAGDEGDNPFSLGGLDPELGGGFQTTPSGRLTTPSGRLGDPFDDMERTQPMSRRTLNLAGRSAPVDGPLPFMPPGDDGGFGLPPGVGGMDEEKLRDDIFEAIAPVLGELASELRRSLDYYRSRGAQVSVDRVLLTGGSANLPNLAAFLQNELQVPVAVANPLGGLTVTAKGFDPNYLATISSAFTVAVGLAARDVVFAANPLPKAPKVSKKAVAAAAAGPNVTSPTGS